MKYHIIVLRIVGPVIVAALFLILGGIHRDLKELKGRPVCSEQAPVLRAEYVGRELKDLHQQADSNEKRLNIQSQLIGDLTQRASLHHHEKNGQAVGPFENPPHQPEPQ